jgi:hypothetical protein
MVIDSPLPNRTVNFIDFQTINFPFHGLLAVYCHRMFELVVVLAPKSGLRRAFMVTVAKVHQVLVGGNTELENDSRIMLAPNWRTSLTTRRLLGSSIVPVTR